MVTSRKKLLHIIVPVYNEAVNFPILYEQIAKNIKTKHILVVVYDFDEDTTLPIVRKYQQIDKNLILYKNTRGRGALNAILSGFDYVKDGPLLVTMADLSDDLSIVDTMYKKYVEGADLVCGSRYMKGGKQLGGPLLKRSLSYIAGMSLYWFRSIPTHDVTNNFKLYDKALLNTINIESKGGFEIAMEITVKAFKSNKAITEVPSIWTDRTDGDSNFKLWRWLPSYIKWYLYALF